MRIRRLELIGFKSFPFATGIEFPEGITAIVGPNGCGKSNILDALMWVMGATSPKLLRGRSMEDVIFSGTEGLAPLGRAEVRLTIDNANKLACEPYRELPEIEIRRVVYRTGEGEFWLNGHRSRLRDITEFFLGTGLGTNSYAIIEQGKVDYVIHARPEERRLLLDESAGISKYKERREISLRKMEATKQNLSRVEDVLFEVNRQANRLKRQAAKARRYQRLKERLDTLLIHRGKLRLRVLEEKQKALHSALEVLIQQTDAKEAEWNTFEVRVSEAHTHLLEKEEGLRSLNVTYAQQRDALGEKREVLSSLREKQGRLEETLRGISETSKVAKQRRTSLISQIEMLEREIKDLEKAFQGRERKLEAVEADYQAEKKRLSSMETDLESRKQAVFETVTAEVDAKNRVSQLSEKIEETERGIRKREADLQEALARFQSLKETISSHQARLASLEGDLKERQDEKKRLEETLSKAMDNERRTKDALQELEKRLTEGHSNLTSLLEIQRRMEDVSSKGAKVLLGQFFDRQDTGTFKGRLVADTIEIESQYDRALEAILRDELEFVLVDNHETALKGLSFLKEKNAGRSGLIPRDTLASCAAAPGQAPYPDLEPLLTHVSGPEEERNIIGCLLKDVWVVENYSRAVEIQKTNGFSGTLVTREGDVFYPNGVIVGGSDEPGSRGRVWRNRKISELSKRIETMEGERNILAMKVEKAEEDSAVLRTRHESVTEALRQVELDLLKLQRDAENAGQEQTRVGQQIEVLEAELDEMRRAVEDLEEELTRSRLSYEDSRHRQRSLREELERYETGIRSLRETVERKGQEANQLRIEEAEAKEKLQGRLQKLVAFREDVESLNVEIALKRQEEVELSENLKEISDEAAFLRKTIKAEETRLSELREKIEAGELNLRRDKESIRTLEKQKAEVFKAFQALKEGVSEKKLEISQQEMEINNLVKEALTRFKVDLKSLAAQETKVGEVEGEFSEAEVEDLEKKISSIGEINFVAIQEFEEMKERITFLERQRADLLEAMQTLRETIQRINRATSSRFKETYDKVQKYFSELFVKLFGGGKAELRLTDPMNYRETGIDIFAQPPGKRLQAIRLLSGGEKALVAIAFLFAMFLTRPSPFCVLDEVDAPLDESNIDRFNQLVVELSELSQFILITHNKHTMACAQSLLGVTMEQPGVSKIVSVSLGEVQN